MARDREKGTRERRWRDRRCYRTRKRCAQALHGVCAPQGLALARLSAHIIVAGSSGSPVLIASVRATTFSYHELVVDVLLHEHPRVAGADLALVESEEDGALDRLVEEFVVLVADRREEDVGRLAWGRRGGVGVWWGLASELECGWLPF